MKRMGLHSGTDRKWLAESLRQSLEALALPGEQSLARTSAGSVRADELALEYDHYFTAYSDNLGADLSASQLRALSTGNEILGKMSGHHNAVLWTEQAWLLTSAGRRSEMPRSTQFEKWGGRRRPPSKPLVRTRNVEAPLIAVRRRRWT
jgi:hypothetical protein